MLLFEDVNAGADGGNGNDGGGDGHKGDGCGKKPTRYRGRGRWETQHQYLNYNDATYKDNRPRTMIATIAIGQMPV